MSGPMVLFLCYLFVRCNGVAKLSQGEDLELEKQLILLNKPSIKTIKTQYGDIYDCVDFYKQPAFDHPLLQNQSYQLEIGKKFQFMVENANQTLSNATLHSGLKDGGCPIGTILIRRITKEDLIREKLASKVSIESGARGTITTVARTKNAEQFTGALGNITPYNPVAAGQQYSAARIKLQNGNEFIEFGWRVDPTLYGDSSTHIFIKTNANSAKCFDARCGFVVTSPAITPGYTYPLRSISVPGKKIKETLLRVRRESDGNWMLILEKDSQPIGFWPSKLFSELTNFATYADWGGEVYSPQDVPGPEMGSGHLPSGNANYDAYIRTITAIDSSGNEVDPNTESFNSETVSQFYDVIYNPSSDPVFGRTVYFGGKENV